MDTWTESVLGMVREYQGEKIIGLFNFSEHEQMAWIDEKDGVYQELITDYEMPASGVTMPPYGFCYLKKLLPK